MDWIYAQSTERPEEYDTTSSKQFNFVRRDITQGAIDDGQGGTMIVWNYLEAKIAKSEWAMYQALEQARADIDYLTMITEE